MNDFLSITGSSPEELTRILHLASAAKLRPGRYGSALAGRSVGLFFMKPSTRTRVSSEVAALQLGAHPIVLKDSEVGLGGRETVEDVARVLDRYLDVLALRVFGHGDLVKIADEANAPVINLLSDREHPCQAVADLQTLAEVRPLEGAKLAFVGDGNNVCHSLMVAGAMVGVEMRIATPPGFEPDESFVDVARRYGSVTVTNDVHEAVRSADAVYTDVWTSMGQEEEKARRLAA
ncbi:MAG: ornithine carbamoyltransferase, partial [Acidimicrobiia bacterium]|nr:ornithine carbamoyltransferase [Acidimicrobiia bacterium]